MFELIINGEVYQFKFGIGFLREMNKKVEVPVEGIPGQKKSIGFQYTLADAIDGNVDALIDMLDTANKGQTPRLTKGALDAYVDDESTDIDELFESVKDFLSNANATKKEVQTIMKKIAEAKAEAEAKKQDQ